MYTKYAKRKKYMHIYLCFFVFYMLGLEKIIQNLNDV